MIEIYNKEQVKNELEKLDDRDPRYRLCESLYETAALKPLATVSADMLQKIEGLKKKFASFDRITSDIKEMLELEFMGKSKVVKIPAILIEGPPGIGKTRYLNELAKILNVGNIKQVDMASASGGFILGGHSTMWKDGKQGVVTTQLQNSPVANPIMVLDEVDKVKDNGHNPIGSLFTLLEKHTAAQFFDEALELPMDCSHIIWFATANSLEAIPGPIKSRFDIYQVKMPDQQQMRNVITSVYAELIASNDWGMSFNQSLSEAVMRGLNTRSPRDLHKSLWKACAKALQRDKCWIGTKDELINLLPIDFMDEYYETKQVIGFY